MVRTWHLAFSWATLAGVQPKVMLEQTIHAQTGQIGMCIMRDKACLVHIRNFATNVGIEFQTPEEYFLHEVPQPFVRDFEPSVYLSTTSTTTTSTNASRSQHVHLTSHE